MADLESLFKALGEPTRLKIVRLLTERHHCARSLSQTLGISEPAVSQHMTVLKRVGLVRFRSYDKRRTLRPECSISKFPQTARTD